jgi:hypothetical protein
MLEMSPDPELVLLFGVEYPLLFDLILMTASQVDPLKAG